MDENGETRLGALDDDTATAAYANLVTSVNCKGASANFDYVQFGIVFYDFEAVPVAANGLDYILTDLTSNSEDTGVNTSTISNGQQQDIMHSADLGDDVKETLTTSISALAGAKLDQSIGANIGWSSTEYQEDSSIGANDDGDGLDMSTSGSAETMSAGLNWGAAWSLAGAAGAEMGHSQETQTSKAVSTAIALPPHTAAGITHQTTKTSFSQSYQQPVVMNYKVALFTTSGDYFSGGNGGINTGSYDKQSYVIKFDTRDEANPFYGCAATDDLYSRAVTNRLVGSYDTSDERTYETHSTASKFSASTNIDWNNVISDASRYFSTNVLDAAKTNYFYETPSKIDFSLDKTSSAVDALYPLYGLASVSTPKLKYTLYANDTLNRESLSVQGYNAFGVPFYGFDSSWGEWNRCDKDGNIINGGYLLSDDPVSFQGTDTLVPKSGTRGGTIYVKWVIEDANAKPITGDSPEGQNLANANIASPVVEIDVVDSALDDPMIAMTNDSTSCFYKDSLVLNNVLEYEVTDKTDKVVATQVKWESRELDSVLTGIHVDADTGVATFARPGIYHVRPYVINNSNEKVFPIKITEDDINYKWFTIVAKAHDLVNYPAQSPTCTTDGCIEHYKCSDCGKYFSDAAGENEISEQDIRVASLEHKWGAWTTVSNPSGSRPGEQQRVCANDASHVETRALYQVTFDANGHGTAPKAQVIAERASATEPAELTAEGYVFEGWCTDESGNTQYNFGSPVTGNVTLYAKWSTAKYAVVAMGIGKKSFNDTDGQIIDPNANGKLSVQGGEPYTEDGYTVSWKEFDYGSVVNLEAAPDTNYGLSAIDAIEVKSGDGTKKGDGYDTATFGNEFEPSYTAANKYSFTMPAADVIALATFDQVTITYNGNAPANATVSAVPDAQTIAYGATPKQPGTNPTATGNSGGTYEFAGWYTDAKCEKPYTFVAPLKQDITLYAKWAQQGANVLDVTYTLYDVNGSPYLATDKVEEHSKAYNPTADLYAAAEKDLLAGYELYHTGSDNKENCWFTDQNCTQVYNFEESVETNLALYAKVVPRTFTVKYFNGSNTKEIGTQQVKYNEPIKKEATLDPNPVNEGYALGWVTSNGAPWNIASTPVTGDLNLYVNWSIARKTVTFHANGKAEDDQVLATSTVDYGTTVAAPDAPKAEGYEFGGWFKESACNNEWNFDSDTVKDDTTLYAKWTPVGYTVTFDMGGHGDAIESRTVDYDAQTTSPTAPKAEGYEFGGWYKDPECTNKWLFDSDKVTGDMTLYAKWTVKTYSITVNSMENGSVTPSAPGVTSMDAVPYGTKVTLTVKPKTETSGSVSYDYGLKSLTVVYREAGSTQDTAVALTKTASGTYTFDMPNGAVTVNATFDYYQVNYCWYDPTIDNNPTEGQQKILKYAYGSIPTESAAPTLSKEDSGYVFGGWYTDKAFTKPYMFTFPEMREHNDVLRLYGKWVNESEKRSVTYTIYDTSGSDPAYYSAETVVGNNEKAYNPTDYINECLRLLKASSEYSYYGGYELYGVDGAYWFTDADCTQVYNANSPVTSDIHLYAKLIPKTYTVTFKSGTGADADVFTNAYDYGTTINTKAIGLSKEGQYVLAWKTTNDDGETWTTWNSSDPITGDVTLVAEWAPYTYDVTFNVNGHGTKPDTQKVAYNGSPSLPKDLTAEGYTFDGWFTDRDCTAGNEFKQGQKITKDTTLFAQWTRITHPVTFVVGGSSTSQLVEYGNRVTRPANPSVTGHTFGGWYTTEDYKAGTEFDFSTKITNSSPTLYAQMTINSYKVTFNANGHGTAPAAQTIDYYGKVAQPDNLTAAGYIFGGWFTDQACTKAYNFDTYVTGDLTLYAKWTPVQHTVTFSANGPGTAPAAQKVSHGSKATNPGNLSAAGYTFGGWFTDQACTKAYNFATPVTADLMLYAKWTVNKVTPATITPAKVAITSASSPLKCKVVVNWAVANNADGYEVATGSVITSVAASKHSVSVVNTKLKAGKTYNVMVRAWHMNGTTKTYGSWSTAKKVKISKYYNAKIKKKTKAYAKASTSSKKKATLKKGAKVKVLKVKGKWAKTNKGWILKSSLKAVKVVNTKTNLTTASITAAASTSSASKSGLTAASI